MMQLSLTKLTLPAGIQTPFENFISFFFLTNAGWKEKGNMLEHLFHFIHRLRGNKKTEVTMVKLSKRLPVDAILANKDGQNY